MLLLVLALLILVVAVVSFIRLVVFDRSVGDGQRPEGDEWGQQYYTRSPLQGSRLFGPRPWKILAATYETNGFLSNPDPGENLVRGNLVMETGCTNSNSRNIDSDNDSHGDNANSNNT